MWTDVCPGSPRPCRLRRLQTSARPAPPRPPCWRPQWVRGSSAGWTTAQDAAAPRESSPSGPRRASGTASTSCRSEHTRTRWFKETFCLHHQRLRLWWSDLWGDRQQFLGVWLYLPCRSSDRWVSVRLHLIQSEASDFVFLLRTDEFNRIKKKKHPDKILCFCSCEFRKFFI